MTRRSTPEPSACAGDRLLIRAHHEGEPRRDAEILEMLGPDATPPYRVRGQDDGRESILYPGSDASIEHLAGRRRA